MSIGCKVSSNKMVDISTTELRGQIKSKLFDSINFTVGASKYTQLLLKVSKKLNYVNKHVFWVLGATFATKSRPKRQLLVPRIPMVDISTNRTKRIAGQTGLKPFVV